MNRLLKKILYIAVFALFIAAALFLIYKMNRVAMSDLIHSNAGNITGSVIKQAIFIFVLEAYGLVLMWCFRQYFSKFKIVMMSFIVGTLMWCLMSLIVVCVGIVFKWYYVAALCLLVLAAAFFTQKPQKPNKEDISFYAKALVLYISFALFFAAFCIFRFSYDSYMYINTGQKIAKLGYISKDLVSIVSGFSLFTPMLFAPSVFFGFDFSQGVYVLLNVQFTLFIGYVVYEELHKDCLFKKSAIAGVLAFLAVASSNIYFELMYWPMSNLLTAMTMFMLIYFAWLAQRENEGINMLFSAFFGICFVLIRSENMLLYICFMFIISLGDIKKKSIALHLSGVAAALALWYFRFFATAGLDFTEGAFLTIDKAVYVIGALVAFIIYILFISKLDIVSKRRKLIERLFFTAMALAACGLAFINPESFVENSRSTLLNMFFDGGWAGALIIFGSMYFIKLLYSHGFDYFDRQTLVFILFFIIIFLLRDMPLRVGYGDSGSRYFAHILPVLAFSVSTTLTKKI